MKTMFIVFAAACFVGTALIQSAQSVSALKPEHQKLEIWLGDWIYEGVVQESPLGPAGKFRGCYNAHLVLGGLNVEFRGEETGPTGTTQWVEIDSYDVASKRYHWNGFGSDGSGQDITYTIDGNTVAFSGTSVMGGKQVMIRGTSVFAPDRMSIVDKREVSTDGQTWKPFSESKTVKAAVAAVGALNAEKELIQLENDWARAYLTNDTKALDRIEAEGWGYTDADGDFYTKAEEIADVGSGDYKATVFEVTGVKVRVFGDTAVVTGRQVVKASFKGKPSDDVFSITDVFQKRDGRWQAIASHLSRRAPPAPSNAQTSVLIR